MKNTKMIVAKEVALDDLEQFINRFVKRPEPREDLEAKYLDVLDAVQDGFLTFGKDSIPTLKLKFPVKNDQGEVSLSELSFKTRILPSELTSISKGLHPINDLFLLQNKMTGFVIGQPVAMLDRFERYDLDVINQLAAVFS